jgi:hypothetical protein
LSNQCHLRLIYCAAALKGRGISGLWVTIFSPVDKRKSSVFSAQWDLMICG